MHAFIVQHHETPDSPDTLKVTPDKSIGIEEVRTITSFLSKKPIHNPFNLVVVYDAHLLTLPAQNAMLKILEEPPAKSQIYLVTIQPDLLIPTILSRCQIESKTTNLQPDPGKLEKSQKLFDQLIQTGVGERLKLLEAADFDRPTALEFMNDLEFIIHDSINNTLLRPPLNLRGGSEGALYKLVAQTRKYLKANCNLKLCLDYFVIKLDNNNNL